MRCALGHGYAVPANLTRWQGAINTVLKAKIDYRHRTRHAATLITDSTAFKGVTHGGGSEISHPNVVGAGLERLIHAQNHLTTDLVAVVVGSASPVILVGSLTAFRETDLRVEIGGTTSGRSGRTRNQPATHLKERLAVALRHVDISEAQLPALGIFGYIDPEVLKRLPALLNNSDRALIEVEYGLALYRHFEIVGRRHLIAAARAVG